MKERKTLVTAVWLIGLYVAAQLIADVSAVKLVSAFGLVFPAGTAIYAVTFTVIDMIHKRLGKKVATQVIIMAGVMNVLMAGYFYWTVQMPYPVFWGLQEGYGIVLSVVPRIVLASIIAEVVSELVDREFYSLWIRWMGSMFGDYGRWQWMRVVLSNLISVPLDSLLFTVIAFWATPHFAWALVLGQIALKYPISLLALPGIYGVKEQEVPFD